MWILVNEGMLNVGSKIGNKQLCRQQGRRRVRKRELMEMDGSGDPPSGLGLAGRQ